MIFFIWVYIYEISRNFPNFALYRKKSKRVTVNDCERNRKCCTANSMRRKGSTELWLMDALSDWLSLGKRAWDSDSDSDTDSNWKRAGCSMKHLRNGWQWATSRPALILLTILFSSPPFFRLPSWAISIWRFCLRQIVANCLRRRVA